MPVSNAAIELPNLPTNANLPASYNVKQLLQDEDTYASTLLVLFIDSVGGEFLSNGGWTAETFRHEIKDAFATDISDGNLGKLITAAALFTTDNLYRGLPSFLCTIHGLLGDGMDWSYAEPIDLDDLAWAMTEAFLLCPPEKDDIYDPQIVAYCKRILKTEGILSPPASLAFAKEEDAYGNITEFDNDILLEQSDRTNEINGYIDIKTDEMLAQIASIPSLGKTAEALTASVQQGLMQQTEDNSFR
jgi:hypothetical protein